MQRFFQIVLVLSLFLPSVLFYFYKPNYTLNKIPEPLEKMIESNSQNDKRNILIFSGFFGCSTVCFKNFKLIQNLGAKILKEKLKIIFLNTDELIKIEDLQKLCKETFHDRVECFHPETKEFQNFFREIELPLYKTNFGLEHSTQFLFIKPMENKVYVLTDLEETELQKLFSP